MIGKSLKIRLAQQKFDFKKNIIVDFDKNNFQIFSQYL